MQEKQLDLKLIEMLNTPVCKMDGKDLVYLIKGVLSEQIKQPPSESQKEEKHFVYGVMGLPSCLVVVNLPQPVLKTVE